MTLIHLLFDNDRLEPVATEKQWHRLGDWSQDVSAPELYKLLNTARSDDIPALTEQMAAARLQHAPDPDVDETVVKALAILEGTEANSVLVTDGVEDGPSELEKTVAAQSEVIKAIQEQVVLLTKVFTEQFGLLTKSLADYANREEPPAQPTVIQFNIPEGLGAALANWVPVQVSNVLPPTQVTVQPAPVVNEVKSATPQIVVQPSKVAVENKVTATPGEVTVKLERPNAHVEMQKKDGKWVADIKREDK